MAPTPQPWKTGNGEQQHHHFDGLQGSKETPIIHLKLSDVPQKKTLLWNLSHTFSYNRSILYQDHGSIVFVEPGFYHVYSQLTLIVTTNGTFRYRLKQKTPHLDHPVTLGSTVAQGTVSQNIALALSGAYCFETGTEIYIDIGHPKDVQPDDFKTFFGAFQVSQARSCSKIIT